MERRSALRKGKRGLATGAKQPNAAAAKVEVENVNLPGQVSRVDAHKYEAMKRAYLKVLPRTSPGLTVAEVRNRVVDHLPEELFPQGATAGWWAKAIQLDLEAKGLVVREKVSPIRLRRT